jgi:hypothetical protein
LRRKSLEENYKFSLELIPIRDLSWELCAPKVPGIQTRTVSGLLPGSLETKNHSDVGATERRREYYMGEGGGFPRVWAVVNLVSPESPMACLIIKGVPESEIINLLVGWM